MSLRLVVAVSAVITFATAGAASGAEPIVTTGSTSSIGSTTAVVTGTVDPRGLATTWLIEYGTTSALGSQSAAHSAGNGTTPVDVTQQLTGLQAGTTYSYRVRATNSDGVAVGAVATFRTNGGTTPVATTGGASLIGPFRALVSGTVDPNGVATDLVRRFRDDHLVRVTDDIALGRERVVGGRRLGRPHRTPVGDGLQLPLRCRRRRGNVARREPHLPHRPRAFGLDWIGARHSSDVGAAHGHRRPQWPLGVRVVRVRVDHFAGNQDE